MEKMTDLHGRLLEGCIWDECSEKLYFVDIECRKIYCFRPDCESLNQMELPDYVSDLVLKKDGTSFVGRAEAIREGTELYHSFGPGWCYSFFDSDGTELTIPFAAREQTEVSFALCVQTKQKINFDSMLRVQAVGRVLWEKE